MKNKFELGKFIGISLISIIIITNFVVADDSYEENDNIYDAKEISIGTYNLTMEDDYDYFFIELEEFDVLVVDLYFNNAISDLDLNIYDSDEVYLDSSSSTTNHEKVKTEVEYDGDYYIEVYNFGGSNNDYNMTIDIEEGSGTDDDDDDDYYEDELFWVIFFILIFGFSFGLPIMISIKKKYDEKKRLKKVSKPHKPAVQIPNIAAVKQAASPPPPVPPPSPAQPEVLVTPPLICPECGVDVDKDASFCQFCGYKL